MATTYEIFCERCGTRHVEKPAPVARGARLRGLLRNAPPDPKDGATPFDGKSFLRVCLACRGYACPACWNDESGYCLDCAPAGLPIGEPASTDSTASSPQSQLGSAPDIDSSLGQFVGSATPAVSDWPVADLAELWDRPLADAPSDEPGPGTASLEPDLESWPTQDAVVVDPNAPLEQAVGPDDQAGQASFEPSADLIEAVTETPEFAGRAEETDFAADMLDSDLLSDGPHVPDMPIFDLSAVLARYAGGDSEAEVEAEPPVETLAEVEPEPPVEMVAEVEAEPQVEMLAEVEPEPPVEMVAEVEAEPPVEMLAEVEPEPPVEMVAEVEPEPPVEMVAEVEAEPQVEVLAEVEPEPPVEMVAEVELELEPVEVLAEVEPEPPVEMVAEVEPEPPVEMLTEVELEPVEVLAEVEAEAPVEMLAEAEAEAPVQAQTEPAPIRVPAPPPADVIWPPAGPPGPGTEPQSVPATQPMLAFQPTSARRQSASPQAFAARRPVPRNLALMTASAPQIRECTNCQLPISVRAHFCRRCGTSQVSV